MPAKQVVDTKTATSTKTSTEPDGTIVEVITTTITDKFSDGSTGTRTEVKTTKKAPCAGATGCGNAQVLQANLTPASSTAPKVENNTDAKFIQDVLETHNKLRAKHGAPPLVINADLAKIAQAWANEVAKKGNMEHSTSGFGENVYWNTDKPPGTRPPEAWYSEIKDFNFSKLEGQKGTGHFTQLIWKASKEVGIAMSSGKNGYYVVANYSPPGNIIG
ncbi:unnamed protein product [Orchesella dallaii]|uniref:SCP domain-containing protein n=1 Tax=Orchesella dallaii TaxID=48710 RepID=A0ABP1QHL8_9HEXA